MKKGILNFRLTEKNGNYGMVFQGAKPIAFAMYDKSNMSLAVAFKKGHGDNHDKTDIVVAVEKKTGIPYGLYDYKVTENNHVFKAHYEKYSVLNR